MHIMLHTMRHTYVRKQASNPVAHAWATERTREHATKQQSDNGSGNENAKNKNEKIQMRDVTAELALPRLT